MADIVTVQELENAKVDAKDWGEAVNEVKVITPRYGEPFKSGPLAVKEIEENGIAAVAALNAKAEKVLAEGLYKGFASETLLFAYKPDILETRARADDTRKIWRWSRTSAEGVVPVTGTWTDTGKSAEDIAAEDATAKANAAIATAAADATTKANAAEANAKAAAKETVGIIDVSALGGNYNLTFAEAVALVPADFKKRFVTIKYNNSEVRTYVNDTFTTNWTNERFWIRKINTMAEGKVNHVDERMIYKGFIINGTLTTQFHADNYCMIIPVYRLLDELGVERKLNLFAYPVPLLPTTLGFLDGKGVRINALNSTSNLPNYTIPAGAEYLFINLQWMDTTTSLMVNEGNLDIAKKYLKYTPDNSATTTLSGRQRDDFESVEYGVQSGLSVEYTKGGAKAIQPFFKSGLSTINGLHISQVVKQVEVQKGQRSLYKPDGTLRKFWIWSIENLGTTVRVEFKSEYENGTEGITLPIVAPIVNGFCNFEWVAWYAPEYDSARVRILVDVTKITASGKMTFGYNGEIHSSVVEKADRVRNVNKGIEITQYMDCGPSSVISNMALPAPLPISLSRKMVNGFLYTEIAGSTIDHQQTTLLGSKVANFKGTANLYVHADATYPNQPLIKVLREKSSIDSMPILSGGQELRGRNDSQYIHPDICYSPTPIGGYNYWMINSNFPYGSDRKEDGDLFVSNNGQDWTRVRGINEASGGGIPFRIPIVPWNTEYPNSFFPIPISGNTLEFAKETVIENSAITNYLAHDPFITCHDGYVIVYIIYNLALDGGSSYQHKYTVCYRSNNGSDWEIVREDGSAMPFNAENAMKIFTKTNGVRNHHRYVYRSTSASDVGFAPQMVKVSDTEWYVYNRENNLVPAMGQTMGLARFKGTTPYTIDYSNKEIVSKNDGGGGFLWHFGARYYNGVFYILTNGFMFTSTDGLNFTTVPYPFFWRGMSSDLYKPSFVVGHDGKVKIVYSIQSEIASPHAYAPQTNVSPAPFNRIFNGFKLCTSLICEYLSLADIVARGQTAVADAYADIVVRVVSQREKTTGVYLLPCVRGFSELQGINVSYDDEVYVAAYLNARNGGKLNFGGVAVTLPGAANK